MVGPMDSLNNLMSVDEEDVKEKIKKYFEEMDLEDEEVERRISCATDIEKGFRNLFILMLTAQIVGESLSDRRDDFVDFAYHDYTDAMVENGYSSDEYYTGQGYVEQYARRRCEEIVDTAILHQADSYYFSTDHSIAIGEDETNAVGNYQREQMAIAQGYTMKTWVTFQDDKVRHSHRLLQGRTINIFKPFEVGTGLMMFPLDVSLGVNMREVYNCRCICEYSGKTQKKTDESNLELREYGDHLKKYLGSASENFPERYNEIISAVESAGGKIIFGDSPDMITNVQKGAPAIIRVPKDVSIGGLEHEYQHFVDDMENGNPGLAYYIQDPDILWKYEKRAYEKELEIAEQYGYNEAIKEIKTEMADRKKEIYAENFT